MLSFRSKNPIPVSTRIKPRLAPPSATVTKILASQRKAQPENETTKPIEALPSPEGSAMTVKATKILASQHKAQPETEPVKPIEAVPSPEKSATVDEATKILASQHKAQPETEPVKPIEAVPSPEKSATVVKATKILASQHKAQPKPEPIKPIKALPSRAKLATVVKTRSTIPIAANTTTKPRRAPSSAVVTKILPSQRKAQPKPEPIKPIKAQPSREKSATVVKARSTIPIAANTTTKPRQAPTSAVVKKVLPSQRKAQPKPEPIKPIKALPFPEKSAAVVKAPSKIPIAVNTTTKPRRAPPSAIVTKILANQHKAPSLENFERYPKCSSGGAVEHLSVLSTWEQPSIAQAKDLQFWAKAFDAAIGATVFDKLPSCSHFVDKKIEVNPDDLVVAMCLDYQCQVGRATCPDLADMISDAKRYIDTRNRLRNLTPTKVDTKLQTPQLYQFLFDPHLDRINFKDLHDTVKEGSTMSLKPYMEWTKTPRPEGVSTEIIYELEPVFSSWLKWSDEAGCFRGSVPYFSRFDALTMKILKRYGPAWMAHDKIFENGRQVDVHTLGVVVKATVTERCDRGPDYKRMFHTVAYIKAINENEDENQNDSVNQDNAVPLMSTDDLEDRTIAQEMFDHYSETAMKDSSTSLAHLTLEDAIHVEKQRWREFKAGWHMITPSEASLNSDTLIDGSTSTKE